MKKTLFPLLLASLLIACNKKNASTHSNDTRPAVNAGAMSEAAAWSASFISKDSANKMLYSYLNSTNYMTSDTNIRSFIIDANALRAYLNDSSQGKIVSLKIMLAHPLSYINSGHQNQNGGLRRNAMTLVLAGFDASNNYIFYQGTSVMDNCFPCPYSCPLTGSAAKDAFE